MCENHVTHRRLSRSTSRDNQERHVTITSRDRHSFHVSRDKDKHVTRKAPAGERRRPIKLVVAGPSGVGKSALVVRFLTKRFIGDYSPQESICERQVALCDCPMDMHIWDTAASSSPREEYINWADGLLLVFSLTDMHSFRHARAYAKQLTHLHRSYGGGATMCYLNNYSKTYSKLPGLPTMGRPTGSASVFKADHGSQTYRLPAVVLVGSKSDLSQARQVSYVQARELAASLRCPYIETSASESSVSVNHAFATLYEHIKLVEQSDLYSNNGCIKKTLFNGKSPVTLSGLKHHLKSLADFRSRTNTF